MLRFEQANWVMLRAKLIILVMVLLFAQLQCAAACAGDLPCNATPHPCHRHHDKAPASCQCQMAGAIAATPRTQPMEAPIFSVLSLAAIISETAPADAGISALDFLDSSPPGFAVPSSVVLRI